MVAFIRTGRVAAGFYLLSLAACGGRTSEVYGDGYDTGSSLPSNEAGGGGKGATSGSTDSGATSSGAGPSKGGAPGTGVGGGASTGTAGSAEAGEPSKGGAPGTGGFAEAGAATAGSAGTGGVTGSSAVACAELCLDPTSPCPNQFGPSAQCANDCLAALSVRNGICQDLGAQLAYCFKNVAGQFGAECGTGASQAALSCSALLVSYQACATGNGPPQPPLSCTGSGGGGPRKCYQNQMCSDGSSFSVTCYEQAPNQSTCICNSGAVTSNLTLNESAVYACSDAFSACGGDILPK